MNRETAKIMLVKKKINDDWVKKIVIAKSEEGDCIGLSSVLATKKNLRNYKDYKASTYDVDYYVCCKKKIEEKYKTQNECIAWSVSKAAVNCVVSIVDKKTIYAPQGLRYTNNIKNYRWGFIKKNGTVDKWEKFIREAD